MQESGRMHCQDCINAWSWRAVTPVVSQLVEESACFVSTTCFSTTATYIWNVLVIISNTKQ